MLNNCSAVDLLPWQAHDQEIEPSTLIRPFHPAPTNARHPRLPARSPNNPIHHSQSRKLPLSRHQYLSSTLHNESLLMDPQNCSSPIQKGGLKRRVELLSEGDTCFKSLSRQHLRRPLMSDSQLRQDLMRRQTNNNLSLCNKLCEGLSKFTNPIIRKHQQSQAVRKVSFSDFVELRKRKEKVEKFKEESSLKVFSRYRHLEEKHTLETSDSGSFILADNSRVSMEATKEKKNGRSKMDHKKWKANLQRGLVDKQISMHTKSRQNLKIMGLLRVHG